MATEPTETGANMDCAELARALDAYLDGELAARDRGEAEVHLTACPACRRLADAQGRVRAAVRLSLRVAMGPGAPAGSAPAAVLERLRAGLRAERAPAWRRWLTPLRMAAVAACAAGVLVVLFTQGRTDPLVEDAVRKHSRDLPLEVTAAALGPESVAGWFAGKLDFNAAPPRFGGGGVRILGARLSHISDRPAAYVRYQAPRGRFGLFIIDDPERRFGEAGRAVRVGDTTVRLANARGFNVAVWRHDEIVYSLVSDLGEDDLARLVRAAQQGADR